MNHAKTDAGGHKEGKKRGQKKRAKKEGKKEGKPETVRMPQCPHRGGDKLKGASLSHRLTFKTVDKFRELD